MSNSRKGRTLIDSCDISDVVPLSRVSAWGRFGLGWPNCLLQWDTLGWVLTKPVSTRWMAGLTVKCFQIVPLQSEMTDVDFLHQSVLVLYHYCHRIILKFIIFLSQHCYLHTLLVPRYFYTKFFPSCFCRLSGLRNHVLKWYVGFYWSEGRPSDLPFLSRVQSRMWILFT